MQEDTGIEKIKSSRKNSFFKEFGFLMLIFIATFLVTISSSYALFSYSTSSGSSMFISYVKQKPILRKDFTTLYNYTEGENTYNYLSNYKAILTSNILEMPNTYTYNDTSCTIDSYKDVSEQGNGQVRLYTYNCGDSKVGVLAQDGGVIAPKDSSYLFSLDKVYIESIQNNITEIDLTYLDTSNVTNMNYMFMFDKKLTKLNISNFDTSKVINMHAMFIDCFALTSLDVSSFNTKKVTDMYAMFAHCSSLLSLDLSNFDTSQVTLMLSMFEGCSALTSLDLRSFNTKKVTNMGWMFYGSTTLTKILVGCNWKMASNIENMFTYAGTSTVTRICNPDINLRKDFVSLYNYTSNDKTYNYLANYTAILTSNNLDMPDTYTYNGVSYTKVEYKDVSEQENDLVRLYTYKSGNTQIGVLAQDGGVIAPADSSNLFYIDHNNNTNMINEIDLTYLDTSNVTTTKLMFWHCENLTKLNISNFDTYNISDMQGMFAYCKNLSSLDLKSFNTSNVTAMNAMFEGCNSLLSIDVSSFDTSKVTNMQAMFATCYKLTSLNLKSFNTSKVTNMSWMFTGDSELASILVGCDWKMASNVNNMFNLTGTDDVTKVCDAKANLRKDFTSLYNYTSNSKSLNYLSEYTAILTSNNLNMPSTYTYNGISYTKVEYKDVSEQGNDLVRLYTYKSGSTQIGVLAQAGGVIAPADSSNLFRIDNTNTSDNINNIKEIDLTYFDTSKVTNMSWMFGYCYNLTKLNISKFDTSNVVTLECMFAFCDKITTIDVTKFDTSKVTNMHSVFAYCTNLTSIDVTKFDTSKVTNMRGMFAYCSSLTSINVSNFNTSNVTTMQTMFAGCSKITSLDLRNFNTLKVTNMTTMFSGSPKLTSIIVGCNWQTAATATNMFASAGVSSVTKVC